MEKQTPKNWPIKSVETVFGIIELLEEAEPMGITGIATELGVAKSTAHDHLRTLEQGDYVVRDDDQYRLGLRFLDLGMTARAIRPIAEQGRSVLDHIAEETDESVWLVVEECGKAVYVNSAMGDRAVPTTGSIGRRSPLHVLASGKAILANLPEERREEIIGRGLEQRTPNTIIDPTELREELMDIRERGVAYNRSESADGIRAVACPVLSDGEVHGAVTCAGPANRMKGDRFEKEVPNIVLGATNELELRLSYP